MTSDANTFSLEPRGDSQVDQRRLELMRFGPAGSVEVEVMIYRREQNALRPFVIVGSVDYPMPPSVEFCETMSRAGLQVIYIRRPGLGNARAIPQVLLQENLIGAGAAVAAEAAVLIHVLQELNLRNIILMGLGTSNPVCFRIGRLSKDIGLSVYANPVFNQQVLEVFRPRWFQSLLGLILKTRNGVRMAEVGLKHQLRKDPVKFYRDVLEKSPGDQTYIAENEPDLLEASRLLLNVQPDTFLYDVRMSLLPDETLTDDYFSNIKGVILSGEETTEFWKSELLREAERLALPTVFAPRGDIFVPYASPASLLSIISDHDDSRGDS